jgi:hypothetical protein
MAGKVGGVQSNTDGNGFTLSAERGSTGLMLSYATREAAIEARKKVAEAFASATRARVAMQMPRIAIILLIAMVIWFAASELFVPIILHGLTGQPPR